MTLTATRTMSARSSFAHPLLAGLRQIEVDGDYGLTELHDTVLMCLIDVSALLYGTDAAMLPPEWGFDAYTLTGVEQVANSGAPFGPEDIGCIEQCLLEPGVRTIDLLFVGHVLNRWMDQLSEIY